MNDLSKKEEIQTEETKAFRKEATATSELLQKKLENFLLLYYQAYLKGEEIVEPEIQTAFLNLVKRDQDLAFKVRMLQLDYLKFENIELEDEWNEATEELFPKVEVAEQPISEHRKKILAEYRETILDLLKSSS